MARHTLKWRNRILNLDSKTHIMGTLNVTPDSFSDGGKYYKTEKAIEHGIQMAHDGADIIDIGGESSRPYSKRISAAEEMDRVLPVIAGLSKEIDVPLSIDTYKSVVAREALHEGASIINDISACRLDPEMAYIAADKNVPLILMHMKGTPENMQVDPVYEDLFGDILEYFKETIKFAISAGVKKNKIIIDPGIGFGKSFDDNLKILKNLSQLNSLNCPVLVGTSNKAFIGHILNKEPHERDIGTMATLAAAAMNGAHIVRVHNVKAAHDTVRIIDAIKRGHTDHDPVN